MNSTASYRVTGSHLSFLRHSGASAEAYSGKLGVEGGVSSNPCKESDDPPRLRPAEARPQKRKRKHTRGGKARDAYMRKWRRLASVAGGTCSVLEERRPSMMRAVVNLPGPRSSVTKGTVVSHRKQHCSSRGRQVARGGCDETLTFHASRS